MIIVGKILLILIVLLLAFCQAWEPALAWEESGINLLDPEGNKDGTELFI
jgi:hypothetical protein